MLAARLLLPRSTPRPTTRSAWGFLAAGEAVVWLDEGRPADAVVAVERWMTQVPNVVLAEDSHVVWPAMVEVALVANAPSTQVSPALDAFAGTPVAASS